MNARILSLAALGAASLGLAACGGGGGGGGGSAVPAGPPPPPAPPQSSTAVAASAGGTVSVSLPSGGTASINVPAGALSQNATVTVTAYTTAASLPKTFSSVGRKTQSIPGGSTFLVGFAVDLGGATLTKPLQMTETSATAVPSGDVVRLAVYGATSNNFNDVDTATVTGTSIANDLNKSYVGISSGTSAIPYAFYAVPAASAATPAPISLSTTSSVATPFLPGTSVTFTPHGSDANGNVYAFVPTVSLDNAQLGTLVTTTTPPYTATLTTGSATASGNIIVTDAARSLTGKTGISVGTSRPVANGDSFSYSGTLTQTFVRTLPTPMPTGVLTTNVTQTIAVASGKSFGGATNLTDFHAAETDVTPTQTTTSTTDTYYSLGAAASAYNLLDSGFAFADSAGNQVTYTYASPIITDILPEGATTSWSNGPGVTIAETDADGTSASRVIASDGTYVDTLTLPGSVPGKITVKGDLSGSYVAPFLGGLFAEYEVSAPSPAASPATGTVITAKILNPDGSTAQAFTFNNWMSTWTNGLYSETDTEASATIPTGCTPGSSVGTPAVNAVTQKINRLDPMLGYTETTTTTSYDAAGVGVVCLVMSDTLSDYYDFNGDGSGTFATFDGKNPYQVTTTQETLALQNASLINGLGSVRKTESLTGIAAAAARAKFASLIGQHRLRKIQTMQHYLRSAGASKGQVR